MLRLAFLVLSLAAFQTACTQDDARQQPEDEIKASSVEEAVTAPESAEGSAKEANIENKGDLESVLVKFKYDEAVLSAEDKMALNAAVEKLKANKGLKIQVVGHTDERGSTEYNLALGERRAQAVREYLNSMGVSGEQITTMSMGEEQPVVDGHDEMAWGQNRRANVQSVSH